jgi:hypothetical protein
MFVNNICNLARRPSSTTEFIFSTSVMYFSFPSVVPTVAESTSVYHQHHKSLSSPSSSSSSSLYAHVTCDGLSWSDKLRLFLVYG